MLLAFLSIFMKRKQRKNVDSFEFFFRFFSFVLDTKDRLFRWIFRETKHHQKGNELKGRTKGRNGII